MIPPAPTDRPLRAFAFGALLVSLVGCAGLPPARAPSPDATLTRVEEPEEPTTLPATPAISLPSAPPPAQPEESGPGRISDGQALFDRLEARLSPPICVRGDHNRQWRRRYASDPAAFERQLRQAMPLMAHVVEAIEVRGLPGEFALIPLVESGYRPDARGPGGPLGLWQMVASTARNRGITITRDYDGRLSPTASTQAALDHLAALHAEFGDWRATAMAYNAGEGRLRRAFARQGRRAVSGERRLPSGLSGITYAYVAKLHALACLIAEPERHGLRLPAEAFAPFDTTTAATNAAATESAAAGVREAQQGRWHVVRSGDTLWRIARRHGLRVADIANANRLDPARPLRIGQRLALPD